MEEERDELFKELAKYIISDPRRISVLADIIHAISLNHFVGYKVVGEYGI